MTIMIHSNHIISVIIRKNDKHENNTNNKDDKQIASTYSENNKNSNKYYQKTKI